MSASTQDRYDDLPPVDSLLRDLLGEWIYTEGVRINYRGRLVGLAAGGCGDLTLVVEPCYRVGVWTMEGLTNEVLMPGRCLLPFGAMIHVGPHPATWPKGGVSGTAKL